MDSDAARLHREEELDEEATLEHADVVRQTAARSYPPDFRKLLRATNE
jgi:hypothetical protein